MRCVCSIFPFDFFLISEQRRFVLLEKPRELVPVGDVEAMATAVIELLNDRAERKRLADNAFLSARERFSLDKMVERTVQVYEAALTGS